MASRPIASLFTVTVVSFGLTRRVASMSSKPVIDRSAGTLIRASAAAARTANATSSLAPTTAVNRRRRLSSPITSAATDSGSSTDPSM